MPICTPCPCGKVSAFAYGRCTTRQIAFTLVELLVVIGIVAVLTAITLPTLAKARRSADSITCASNLRQVAATMVNYETMFGQFPLLRDPTLGSVHPSGPGATPLAKTWVDVLVEAKLLPSVDLARGELGVLRCPSAVDFDADPSWLSYMPHYGYNLYVNPPVANQASVGERSFQGRRSNMRREADRKILLADSKQIGFRRGWHGIAQYVWVDPRHGRFDSVNVAFLAGQVELIVTPKAAPTASNDPRHPFAEIAFVRKLPDPVATRGATSGAP